MGVDEHFEGALFTAGACITHGHLTGVGVRLESVCEVYHYRASLARLIRMLTDVLLSHSLSCRPLPYSSLMC